MAGSWLTKGRSGDPVDVHELVDAAAMKGLLEIVEAGALLSMGTTSDGGALMVQVTIDGEWRREYFRTADELHVYLAEAVPAVSDLLASGRPSPAPKQRARRSGRS